MVGALAAVVLLGGCVVNSGGDEAATVDATIAALEARLVVCEDMGRLAQARDLGDAEGQAEVLEVLSEAPFEEVAAAAVSLAAVPAEQPNDTDGEPPADADEPVDPAAPAVGDGEVTADDLAEPPAELAERAEATEAAEDALDVMSGWARSRCGITIRPAGDRDGLDIDLDDGVPLDELTENISFVDVLAAVRQEAATDAGWWDEDGIRGTVTTDAEVVVVSLSSRLTGADAVAACDQVNDVLSGIRDEVTVWLEDHAGQVQAMVMADGSCQVSEASTATAPPN